MSSNTVPELPGLNCGLCGHPTCEELAARLAGQPELIRRCIPLDTASLAPGGSAPAAVMMPPPAPAGRPLLARADAAGCDGCGNRLQPRQWVDSLGREFDFVLRHFPEDPGPREVILPHNPMLTREMNVQKGDVLIGRPLGMSCGCPITHCGVVSEVDPRTGVITWCVTGPLRPRQEGFKDIGYYAAEAYEGLILESRGEIRIGARYFFQPDMCMLQWRHSGLVNYLNRSGQALQVRVEGLWIG